MIAARAPSAGRLSDAAASFRAEMGLPQDGPLIMSGHQAGFWHPGIVAKYAAVRSASADGASAWLVADLDDNQPLKIRLPRRGEDGTVRAETFDLAAAPTGHPDAPTGLLPVAQIVDAAPKELEPVAAALRHAAGGTPSLAAQAHAAAARLLDDIGVPPPKHTIFATAIGGTALFAAALEAMATDPAACVQAYNAAVAAHPHAGVRPLAADPGRGRWELPVWRVGPGQPRLPLTVSGREPLDPTAHAPRGLLMTGLLRAAGCDLFIHGTGGGMYDTITERWLADWLGMALAPAAVVSATLHLDLGLGDMTAQEAQAQIAHAHRARHDPAILGDDTAAAAKRAIVARIAALDRAHPDRPALYARMHELLEGVRSARADRLAEIEHSTDAARAVLRSREVLTDRTWSFVLHEPRAIKTLCASVAAAFSPAPTRLRG